jgi:hypothetical protein
MTSNQALIAGVVTSDPDGELVTRIIDELKKDGKVGEEGVEAALDLFVRASFTPERKIVLRR